MSKRVIEPNTTFYPVAVALITTGGETPNIMTANRLASVSAEPPRLALSVRPVRFSHQLIRQSGEFVVNLPSPEQAALADYAGVVSGRKENKIEIAHLRLAPILRSISSVWSSRRLTWIRTPCSLAGCRRSTLKSH